MLFGLLKPDPGALGYKRAPGWNRLRKWHLKRQPTCAACGAIVRLDVHHIRPFHRWPQLELCPDNLITLCETHHLWWGHLGNWESWNLNVIDDAAMFLQLVTMRP